MQGWLSNVYRLGLKEFRSLLADRLLLGFIIYSFTVMIYSEATGVKLEVANANVGIVDADRSELTRRIRDALIAPQFKTAMEIDRSEVDALMDRGRLSFVLDLPPRFEADILAGRQPIVQLNIDATAMAQAGAGASYIEEIATGEVLSWLQSRGIAADLPVRPVVRALFNPNLDSIRYQAVMSLIENITMISILLVGAAVVREREHGTIEHLLVMPVSASQIAAAKIWANGCVVLTISGLALLLVINRLLGVPIQGSFLLFLFGTAIYLFAMTALGILLATIANSMPQLGLLSMPVFLILSMLSGSTSPVESMPPLLQTLLLGSPSVHYVKATHGILFRGAGLDVVWHQLAVLAGLGAVFLAVALARFRAMLARHA